MIYIYISKWSFQHPESCLTYIFKTIGFGNGSVTLSVESSIFNLNFKSNNVSGSYQATESFKEYLNSYVLTSDSSSDACTAIS